LVDRWLSLRLDFLSTLIVASIALLGAVLRDSLDSGLISLAVLNAMLLTGILQWAVRCTVEVENNMTSVERLMHFSKIPSEGLYRVKSSKDLANWPDKGVISFRDVKLRFRPELDLVLKGISFDIFAKEKIGICGRTGSGKSTTILALFRVVPLEEGAIFIDDIDISSIGVGDLRDRICIIPQDPVLLSGSLRFNLDVIFFHYCKVL
jgi:ATP-binding cassette subfamily C (CFTR/MRP) protein 1